jgi:hypothetical protein
MSTRPGDLAELNFERYLKERGYAFEHEPDWGTPRRPDYRITTDQGILAGEVKSFETCGILDGLGGGQFRQRPVTKALEPIRKQIKDAAGQLKVLTHLGIPLVVVLDNPGNRPVSLEPHMVISAMYGDLSYSAALLEDGSMEELTGVLGRNGKLTNDHQYISAVAIIRRRDFAAEWAANWFDENRIRFDLNDAEGMITAYREAVASGVPIGDSVSVEVFETLSETAVPLPRTVFNGPEDVRWVPNAARDGLTPLGGK